MFGTVTYLLASSGDFQVAYLLLLNARRVQTLLQHQNFLIAFDASELLFSLQESCSSPAQRLISFSPALYVPRHPLHRRQARLLATNPDIDEGLRFFCD